jgi:CBS domain-containing protein
MDAAELVRHPQSRWYFAGMTRTVQDVMVADVVVVPSTTTLAEAAEQMRDHDIGDVIVQDAPGVEGILTDRDIVVRAAAESVDLDVVTVGDICSTGLATVRPDDTCDRAVALMRERAVRRLPVMEDGRIVGVISLGDLAIDLDRRSVLADISAAEPQL